MGVEEPQLQIFEKRMTAGTLLSVAFFQVVCLD